ncbi:MAG: hypothetical protein ACP5QA_08115 [Phycisphaerae bacterium]
MKISIPTHSKVVACLALLWPSLAAARVAAATVQRSNPSATVRGGDLVWRIVSTQPAFRSGWPVMATGILRNNGQGAAYAATRSSPSIEIFRVIGPDGKPAPSLRVVRWDKGRFDVGPGRFGEKLPPGGHCRIGPLVVNSKADMTQPGRYEIFGSYGNVVSKPIFVRILPPSYKPVRPVLVPWSQTRLDNRVRWGRPWHGLEIRLYQIERPNTRTGFVVNLRERESAYVLLRADGQHRVKISLTGLPDVDFRRVSVTGPAGQRSNGSIPGPVVDLAYRPVPLTAYSKILAHRRPIGGHRFTLVIQPGQVYRYVQPIVLTERFDMSLRGHYRAQAGLAGTQCRTEKILIP